MTWKSGERPRSRSGAQLLDQPLERQVLVGEGAEGASRAPAASSSRKPRVAGEVGAQRPGC